MARAARHRDEEDRRHEIAALIVTGTAILAALALGSYRWDQVHFDAVPVAPTNWIGPVGAYLAWGLVQPFGAAAALVPLALGAVALGLGIPTLRKRSRFIHVAVLFLALLVLAHLHPGWSGPLPDRWRPYYGAGGAVGYALADRVLVRFLNVPGAHLVAVTALLVGLVGILRFRPLEVVRGLLRRLSSLLSVIRQSWTARADLRRKLRLQQRQLDKRQRELERKVADKEREARRAAEAAPAPPPASVKPKPAAIREDPAPPPPPAATREKPRTRNGAATKPASPPAGGESVSTPAYTLPSLAMLEPTESRDERSLSRDVAAQARVLQDTLEQFGVDAEVRDADRGPVITRFEVYPAPGVKVERISSLANNISLALKATSVRILAPIPGRGAVGVEVPNTSGAVVRLSEMLSAPEWTEGKAQLPLAVGKDVSGKPIVADLASMPHLLIAGATGSGKTICVNSMIVSLLFRHTPETLRMILIDPKIVEMSGYAKIPHLVMPVMTDPKKIPLALRWAIKEMESRYQLMARAGVRNITAYNSRPKNLEAPAEAEDDRPPLPDKLPYIIVIIDELADLMQTARPEVEGMVARLAQLSRAVGIHMIIATQRPSVDVLTGVIKANFPARIAFQVASRVDSRTILDSSGADKLLGRGDLLFLPPGSSKLLRAQGTMASDEEIRRIVEFWSNQGEPDYAPQAVETLEQPAADISDADEELVQSALEVIRQTQRASASLLQRRLRIGYTRAARVMDVLEERGVVGPGKGAEPREILVDLDEDGADMPEP